MRIRGHGLDVGRLRQLHRFAVTVRRLAAIMRARRPALILNWSAKTQLYGSCAALLAGMSSRVVWWQQSIPDGSALDRAATMLPARAILCYSESAARAQRRMRPVRDTFPIAAGSAVPRYAGEPVAIELPAGVPVVGIVGRLEPWKGQDRLLRAQALLRARGFELPLPDRRRRRLGALPGVRGLAAAARRPSSAWRGTSR